MITGILMNNIDGIEYKLVSSDGLDFKLLKNMKVIQKINM